MPATPNQADGDRRKKKRDYFRHAAQPLFAHPARKSTGIAERDRHQCQIYQKRNQRKKQPHSIDQNQQGRKQRWPGDERHAKRNNTKFVAATAIVWLEAEQFARGQAEQNQTTCHLKIRHCNSKRGENNLPEKNKPYRYAKSSEDS